ncbi:MAG TPA: hypothetical protein VF920_13485 [Dongiaceae bacterium]
MPKVILTDPDFEGVTVHLAQDDDTPLVTLDVQLHWNTIAAAYLRADDFELAFQPTPPLDAKDDPEGRTLDTVYVAHELWPGGEPYVTTTVERMATELVEHGIADNDSIEEYQSALLWVRSDLEKALVLINEAIAKLA